MSHILQTTKKMVNRRKTRFLHLFKKIKTIKYSIFEKYVYIKSIVTLTSLL